MLTGLGSASASRRTTIRVSVGVLLAGVAVVQSSAAQAPPESPPEESDAVPTTERIGTMSDLMVHIIYPASDAVFYITTRAPSTTAEWSELEAKTLMLAESANLLMMPSRARGRDQWLSDAKLMLDAGQAAFFAAKDRDLDALEALNDQLYQSCVTCHRHFRPGYGRRR